MKSQFEVLDLLFPKGRAEILRLLFSKAKGQRYVRELMIMSGLALRTVQEELATLSAIGLVTSWSNGYHRFYRANRDHPLFGDFCSIVQTSARLRRPKLPAHRRRRVQSSKRKSSVTLPRKRRRRRQVDTDAQSFPAVRSRSFPLRLAE